MNYISARIWFAILSAAFFPFPAPAANVAKEFDATTETVGTSYGLLGQKKMVTPVNQIFTPAGWQIELPLDRPQALALSPDRRILVAAGRGNQLAVIWTQTGKVLQTVTLPAATNQIFQTVAAGVIPAAVPLLEKKPMMSLNGLAFSPDGSRIFLSNAQGNINVFAMDKDFFVSPLTSLAIPAGDLPPRTAEIPTGIAVAADGTKIYVALNLSNRLLEMDAATGKELRRWDVGVAPFDVVVAGEKIYVSNWGGQRPTADDLTGPAGGGARVLVDPVRFIASEGSVSVIDLLHGRQTEVPAGRHAGALALSPDGKFLAVANAGSDTVNILDTHSDKMIESILLRQNPGDPFGAQPVALTFDKSGQKLFVCNGTQNAVAVVQFDPGNSRLLGLIPVGWFPDAVALDAGRNKIYVANNKTVGGTASSISMVTLPSHREIAKLTQTALANLRYPLLAQAMLPPRADQPARPVPERAGEPSVFQHVIYIIKENRTYDQILGDVKSGNGDASLCNFKERVTPNQHRLVRDFVLLDNTYCCGSVSADGHQWTDSALANDYVERSFSANWPRSYPYKGEDALAYSPVGFIWDNALAHGKTVRDYGEFADSNIHWRNPHQKDALDFLAVYHDFTAGANAIAYHSEPNLESLRPYLATNWPAWAMSVPDVVRADLFIKDLKQFARDGTFPNLIIMSLPNDHTSGTGFGAPTPEARIADNDLALGRIVEAVSHSTLWSNTCILAVEDDPQSGWDHVSGYRTTAYIASAYTKRHTTISTQYNQTSLLRTLELMLGLPPLNQMDATATPMFDCFNDAPDATPFDAVANNVPLDEMNPAPKDLADPQLRKDAKVSARLPLSKPDLCPEDVLNGILWRATMPGQPYPTWAVKNLADD